MLDHLSQTRRDFLKSGDALVITFSLAGHLSPAFAEAATSKTVAPDEVMQALRGAILPNSGSRERR
jgi:hypothetical protein